MYWLNIYNLHIFICQRLRNLKQTKFKKKIYYKIRMRGHVHKIIFVLHGYTKNVYYAKEWILLWSLAM